MPKRIPPEVRASILKGVSEGRSYSEVARDSDSTRGRVCGLMFRHNRRFEANVPRSKTAAAPAVLQPKPRPYSGYRPGGGI